MTCSDLPTLHPFIQRSPTDLISTEIISIAFYCFCRRYPQSRGDRLLIYYSQYFFLIEWMNEHIVFLFPLLSPFCVKATLSSPYHPQDDCCKRQQNTGLQHLLNLDKCATCCALKLQCNGQMQGVGFYTKTYSTKRICWQRWQRWHSASKWGCKKKRGREAFERNFWSSCSYKTPQIPKRARNTTARMRALFT